MWSNFRQLPLVMRVGAVAGALGVVVIIGSYILVFRAGHLSSSSGDWGNFGSYLAGTVGSLLSLLSLGALYVTYLQQIKASATSALSGEIQALAQSIESCQRETRGTGHAYFETCGQDLWTSYIDIYNHGYTDAWKTARATLAGVDAANWTNIGSQIKRLLQVVASTTSLSGIQRSDAMAKLQALLSPGIALLLAVDAYLNGSNNVVVMAEQFGLLRSIAPHIRESLVADGLYSESAFERNH
jgi:hypothetical protein